MSALDGWIDVCRAGTWRDMQGRDVRLDEDRLDRIVATHADADPAPVVVGHPEADAPAYAWIDGLRRVGDRLQAKLRDIAPSFREAVEAGRYGGRSIALQGDTLRHVGFLGGRAPAVPGLAPTRFASEPETVVAFGGWEKELHPALPSSLPPEGQREDGDGNGLACSATPGDEEDDGGALSLSAPGGGEGRGEVGDDAVIAAPNRSQTPSIPVEQDGFEEHLPHPDPLRTQGPTGDEDGTSLVPLSAPEGRGGNDGATLAERESALAARETALLARQATVAADDRRRVAETALAPHVEAGRILPAERAGLVALLAALSEHEDADDEGAEGRHATIAFASASGGEVRMRPLVILERFIEGLPRRVDYRTLAGGPVPEAPGLAGVREGTGEDSERIAAEARALMAVEAEKGVILTPAEAVDRARARRGLGTEGEKQ